MSLLVSSKSKQTDSPKLCMNQDIRQMTIIEEIIRQVHALRRTQAHDTSLERSA